LSGSVAVQPGGRVDIENSVLTGGVGTLGAGAIRVCGSTIGASVVVASSKGPVVIGYAAVGCAANAIGGGLSLLLNPHGVQVIGNRVRLKIVALGNTGAGPFPADSAPRISGNGPA
jgi:hypothetical protein